MYLLNIEFSTFVNEFSMYLLNVEFSIYLVNIEFSMNLEFSIEY